MKIIEINGQVGIGEVTGVQRKIHLNMVDQPKVGDYVLVHAGFAIEIIDEAEAIETIKLLQEIQVSTM